MPRIVMLLTFFSLGVAASPASAATVGHANGVITFQAAAGEANSPSIDVSFGGDEFILRDANATVTAGSGCSIPSPEYAPKDVYCPKAGVTRIRFLLGDADDSILVYSTVPANVTTEIDAGPGGLQSLRSESSGPTVITGGPGPDQIATLGANNTISSGAGDDTVTTGDGADDLDLGPGDDSARGGPGADTIQGGDGVDLIYGDAGADVVRGGAGNDNLWGEQDADVLHGEDGDDNLHDDGSHETGRASGDVLHGGAGKDLANYNSRGGTDPVNISLDGAANDGAAGEADNVGPEGDIEVVWGTGNDDVLTGNDSANELNGDAGNDKIDGRGGNDVLSGLFGSDQLAGGAGDDTINGEQDNDALLGEDGNDNLIGGTGDDRVAGGAGADTLDGGLDSDTLLARDGVVDTIRCSLGRDAVEADANDTFADRGFCEAIDGVVNAVFVVLAPVTLRYAVVIRRGIAVTSTLPGAGRVSVVATVPRATARRMGVAARSKAVTIGRGARSAAGPGRVTVRVKLTSKARKRLRRVRSAKVTLKTTFRAADGKSTVSTRRITLRR